MGLCAPDEGRVTGDTPGGLGAVPSGLWATGASVSSLSCSSSSEPAEAYPSSQQVHSSVEPRHREAKQLALGHTANAQRGWALTPSSQLLLLCPLTGGAHESLTKCQATAAGRGAGG